MTQYQPVVCVCVCDDVIVTTPAFVFEFFRNVIVWIYKYILLLCTYMYIVHVISGMIMGLHLKLILLIFILNSWKRGVL